MLSTHFRRRCAIIGGGRAVALRDDQRLSFPQLLMLVMIVGVTLSLVGAVIFARTLWARSCWIKEGDGVQRFGSRDDCSERDGRHSGGNRRRVRRMEPLGDKLSSRHAMAVDATWDTFRQSRRRLSCRVFRPAVFPASPNPV